MNTLDRFVYSADRQNAVTTIAQAVMRVCIGAAALIFAIGYQP